jgi:hypothetical protein
MSEQLRALSPAEIVERDAYRYRWLRDGNAYEPEEAGVSGGELLDALCDKGIASAREVDILSHAVRTTLKGFAPDAQSPAAVLKRDILALVSDI